MSLKSREKKATKRKRRRIRRDKIVRTFITMHWCQNDLASVYLLCAWHCYAFHFIGSFDAAFFSHHHWFRMCESAHERACPFENGKRLTDGTNDLVSDVLLQFILLRCDRKLPLNRLNACVETCDYTQRAFIYKLCCCCSICMAVLLLTWNSFNDGSILSFRIHSIAFLSVL